MLRQHRRQTDAQNGIRAKSAKKFRNTTDSNHSLPVAENHLDRQFDVQNPNERWVADITYISTREGWLYLAVVEDLYSRRVVGWSMADHMQSRLVVDALEMAVARRVPGEGLLTHSDRGSQYASGHYQQFLAKHGIACSMSGVGQCWDNAPMESFFASLKKELTHHEDYQSRAEARASIFEYIEVFYNHTRRHSALSYLSPEAYERSGQSKAPNSPPPPKQTPTEQRADNKRAGRPPAEPREGQQPGRMPALAHTDLEQSA